MALPLGDYDPSRVIQTIGDITPVAYGPDTRISIVESADRFLIIVGQDGHIIRVKNRAITTLVTSQIMKTDPANNLLMDLLILDVNGLDGAGIVPYLMQDNNGTAKVSSKQCWITRVPDLTYTASGEAAYNWTFQLGATDSYAGAFKSF